MGQTKHRLQNGQVALGAWMMIGHPTIAEVFAGEGFHWIGVDMEHTATGLRELHEIALALKGSDCDLLVRMPGCDEALAKKVLDTGATGLIVPLINTAAQAAQAVAMTKYPPEGIRGAAFSRASDFGRNFSGYYESHNERSLVVVMLEHIDAVANIDEILATEGIDAMFIGPYDLSASMGLAGQTDHPDVVAAERKIIEAAARHNVPAGYHVVAADGQAVQRKIDAGVKFIGCSLDTEMLIGCSRSMLEALPLGEE
jgi:2-dehydro-3-deoxyglucarate aldolase